MKIEAFLDKERKVVEVEVKENAAVKDALHELNINPVEVIVSRKDELVLEDEKLQEGDKIKVLSVISGG